MTESKIELTERLRREGRWAEASKFKDTALKEFRAKGMKRTEAAEAAWGAMATAFPPLPPIEPPPILPPTVASKPPSALEEAASCQTGHAAGFTMIPAAWGTIPDSAPLDAEVDWVHQNRVLVVEERPGGSVRLHWDRARKPAPSFGAINLMEFAATNRKGFMDILQRVKPDGGEAEIVQREKKSVAEIRKILQQMNAEIDAKLLDDVSQGVRDRVRALLGDWSRRHALTLSEEAATSLEAHVADLVQHCLDATAKAGSEAR